MLESTRETLSTRWSVGSITVHLVRLELPTVHVPVLVLVSALNVTKMQCPISYCKLRDAHASAVELIVQPLALSVHVT